MYCTKCGKSARINQFCTQCGYDLRKILARAKAPVETVCTGSARVTAASIHSQVTTRIPTNEVRQAQAGKNARSPYVPEKGGSVRSMPGNNRPAQPKKARTIKPAVKLSIGLLLLLGCIPGFGFVRSLKYGGNGSQPGGALEIRADSKPLPPVAAPVADNLKRTEELAVEPEPILRLVATAIEVKPALRPQPSPLPRARSLATSVAPARPAAKPRQQSFNLARRALLAEEDRGAAKKDRKEKAREKAHEKEGKRLWESAPMIYKPVAFKNATKYRAGFDSSSSYAFQGLRGRPHCRRNER